MRTTLTIAALAFASLAQAAAPVEVKAFKPKSLEMDASALEFKTKDVGGSDLDRKLAGKKAKTTVDDSSVMRAPSKPAILEAAEAAEAAAETAAAAPASVPAANSPASVPNRKANAGSR